MTKNTLIINYLRRIYYVNDTIWTKRWIPNRHRRHWIFKAERIPWFLSEYTKLPEHDRKHNRTYIRFMGGSRWFSYVRVVAQTIYLWAAIESVLLHNWRPVAFPVRNILIIALRKCCALPVKAQRKISNDKCLSRRRVLSLPLASFRFIQYAFRQAKSIFGQQAVTGSIRILDSFRHTGVYFPSRVSSVWNKRRAALLILKWFLT